LNQRIDLHIHTTASDGTWDIPTLLEKLRAKGIGIFSVTDHDALESTQALWRMHDELPEHFVPGVELSVTHKGKEHHLTCYAFDPMAEEIAAIVQGNRDRRDAFNLGLIYYASEQYEGISAADYEEYVHERGRGGWKALWYLMDRGAITEMREFFMMVMRWGVPMEFPSPAEAISQLRGAGARVMLAHPSVYRRRRMEESELDEWTAFGVDGLECYSTQTTEEDSQYYVDYCDRKGLMISGGSDCHGDFVSRELGEPPITPDDIRVDFL
jgi:predicted metal-dependent phosphoesterase TrpH